jgi:hypothetical protein
MRNNTVTNKGLIVDVLRSAKYGDSTNGGVTSTHDSFVVVDSQIAGIFEPTNDMPALKLVRRTFGQSQESQTYIHAEPLAPVPSNCVGYMFGGNFIYSCDSRFREVNQYPIPVHDRIETAAQYDRLSR